MKLAETSQEEMRRLLEEISFQKPHTNYTFVPLLNCYITENTDEFLGDVFGGEAGGVFRNPAGLDGGGNKGAVFGGAKEGAIFGGARPNLGGDRGLL